MIKGGPKIINDGLVLCLDAHDAKSYAGEPVTNLVTSTAVDFSVLSTYTDNTFSQVADSESPSGYACEMSYVAGANSSSRCRFGASTNIPTSGSGFVSIWVKRSEGPSTSMVPSVYTGYAWYTLEPLDGGSSYITEKYRPFGVAVIFGTNSSGPNPGFSMIYGGNSTVNDKTRWIKPQVTTLSYNTPFANLSRSATNGWTDRTTNNNDGTLVNGTDTGVSHYRDGQVIMPVANSYLDFDGSNQYVLTNFTPSSDDVKTISVWIYWDAASGGNGFEYIVGMDFSDANNGHIPVSITSSGQFRFRQQSSSLSIDQTIYTDAYVSTGEWTNLVISSDGSAFSFYKNGVKASISSGTNNGKWFSFLSGPIMIGSSDWISVQNYDYFNGKIANVTIYNKQLTDAEVLSNYNATKERF